MLYRYSFLTGQANVNQCTGLSVATNPFINDPFEILSRIRRQIEELDFLSIICIITWLSAPSKNTHSQSLNQSFH